MKKFYLTEIAEGDAKISGKAVYEYAPNEEEGITESDAKRLAVAAYHGKISTAMKSDLYTYVMLVVMDSMGVIIEPVKVVER